jgi:DNA-binding HxlR family transcriptional regulator
MLAKALDRVGDRWTMLIVRDLAGGPKRFTDLMERLGGITPKTLTQRLRDLEEGGLTEVDREPGRREVWYRLTPAGRDLLPALEELMVWGLRHVAAPPGPGEPAHPEHILWALRVQLEREGVRAGPLRWLVRLVDDGSYVIRSDGHQWTFEPGEVDEPEVLITATKDALARYLAIFPTHAVSRGARHPGRRDQARHPNLPKGHRGLPARRGGASRNAHIDFTADVSGRGHASVWRFVPLVPFAILGSDQRSA